MVNSDNVSFLSLFQLGTPQELPKKLRLVVDVSGSMYRFNGHDGRLEREMSAVLMVMEALEGYENKFKVFYKINYYLDDFCEEL